MNRKEKSGGAQTELSLSRINSAIVSLISGETQRGRTLELGAGKGALSLRLAELGFDMTAADFDPESFIAPGIPCERIDVEHPFPFPGESFDFVIGAELIEHLEDHFSFIRECGRVLKPGGCLILSTPNLLNLASRLKYLLTGFYSLCQRPNSEFERIRLYQHINPVNYYNLRFILHSNNFRIRSVKTDRYRRSSLSLAFLYPFIRFFTGSTMQGEPDERQTAVNREIQTVMLSPEILFGRTLIVAARKEPPHEQAHTGQHE